jgi:hypothetical protein
MLERNQHAMRDAIRLAMRDAIRLAMRDAIRLACSRKFASHGVDATVESKRGIMSRVACK